MSQESVKSDTASESSRDSNDAELDTMTTFADHLNSPVVAVIVGQQAKTFHIHRALLTRESSKMYKQLYGDFKEAMSMQIELVDEDCLLFAHFAKYLYSQRPCDDLPNPQQGHASHYVLLARLYAMGERLMATSFQDAVLRNFTAGLSYQTSIPESHLCDLLAIACDEIAERVDDDPMRKQIFWYASKRLSYLQTYPHFKKVMLQNHAEIGRQMTLRAGNSSNEQPSKPKGAMKSRFENEHGA